MMLFCVLLIFAFFHFLGAKSVFGLQKWSKPPKTIEMRNFAFCAKIAPKVPKKHLLEQYFWPMPVLSVLERKERKSVFWAQKCAKTHFSVLFGPKSQKSHFWSEK